MKNSHNDDFIPRTKVTQAYLHELAASEVHKGYRTKRIVSDLSGLGMDEQLATDLVTSLYKEKRQIRQARAKDKIIFGGITVIAGILVAFAFTNPTVNTLYPMNTAVLLIPSGVAILGVFQFCRGLLDFFL